MQLTVVPDYSGAISQIGQDIFSCSAMGNLSLLDLKIFHKVSNIEYIINWKGFDKCLLVYVKIILGNIIWSFLCLSMLIIIRRFATVSLDGQVVSFADVAVTSDSPGQLDRGYKAQRGGGSYIIVSFSLYITARKNMDKKFQSWFDHLYCFIEITVLKKYVYILKKIAVKTRLKEP